MTKLPPLSGKEVITALQKAGFYQKRRKSSHIIMRRDAPFAQVTVPDHKVIDRGTLQSILKYAGLSKQELLDLL